MENANNNTMKSPHIVQLYKDQKYLFPTEESITFC